MADPCNECGACCYRVTGTWSELWRQRGWIRDDGRCVWYNMREKTCSIYENRPDQCRMELTKPPGMSLDKWYKMEKVWCDAMHQQVFACPREEPTDGEYPSCNHQHPWLELQLETVSSCQGRCFFCPYSKPVNSHRRGKLMDDDLFRKIIDEAVDIDAIRQVSLQGLGEPLLDPHIVDRVAYIASRPRQIRTLMHTNGILLTPDMSKALHDAGLSMLVISINSVNSKQWEQVFNIKSKYDQVCAHARAALKLPGWSVALRAVINGDVFTSEDADTLVQQWGAKNTIVVGESNWISHNRTLHQPNDPNLGCARALTQIYSDYDGNVGMCCMDSFMKKKFGNLRESTIREIYNSEAYTQFRLTHAEDRAMDIPECRGCTRC